MLLRCSPLLLLSMLQLVVLSGLVAAYIFSHSYPQPPTRQTETGSTPTFRDSFPGHERTLSLHVKSGVMLKPITLSYLRENIEKVSSLLDFVRLFTDPEIEDHHINHLKSRTIRSASHSRSHPFHMNRLHYRHDENTDFSDVGENNGGNGAVNENFMSFDTTSTVVSGVSDEASDAADHDNGYDYPEDEPSSDDVEAFEAALHHIEEMKTCTLCKCQRPTPYVLHVHDDHDWSRVFIPECVTLHRCMNYSGCCGDGDHECAPKSMNIVVKSFMVVNRLSQNDEDVMFDVNMATTLSFLNHTECECREKPKLPKCTNKCPRHFRLSQEWADCFCDCFPLAGEEPWECESVKHGVTSLSAGDLACILNGTCYTPRCVEGEFDLTTGYCPLSNEYSLPAFMFENPTDRHHYREHLRNLDIASLLGKVTLAADGSLISPTPATKSDAVLHNSIDKLKDIEDFLSRNNYSKWATQWESGKIQEVSNKQDVHTAYPKPTQNVSEISEPSNASYIEVNSTLSVGTNDSSSKTDANVSLTNELHSPVYRSNDNEHTDNDEADDIDDNSYDYDDFYSEFSSRESSEGQGVIDSTSQVKVHETANQVSVASTALPGDIGTKDIKSKKRSFQNVPNDLHLLLSSATGNGHDSASINDNDDDGVDNDNDDDDDDYTNEDVSNKNSHTDSSNTDYNTDSLSADHFKDSEDLPNKNYIQDSLNTDYYADSSFEDYHKDSTFDDRPKDSLNKHHRNDPPRKDRFRVERQTAMHNNLRHNFQTDSQFHETVRSDGSSDEELRDSKNINSEYRSFEPLSAAPTIAPSYYSTPATKLPNKRLSSQTSSSSPKLSSLSPQSSSSSPLSKRLMISLKKSTAGVAFETSTKIMPKEKKDLKSSTETLFLRRLYKHREASSEGSGEDRG